MTAASRRGIVYLSRTTEVTPDPFIIHDLSPGL